MESHGLNFWVFISGGQASGAMAVCCGYYGADAGFEAFTRLADENFLVPIPIHQNDAGVIDSRRASGYCTYVLIVVV